MLGFEFNPLSASRVSNITTSFSSSAALTSRLWGTSAASLHVVHGSMSRRGSLELSSPPTHLPTSAAEKGFSFFRALFSRRQH